VAADLLITQLLAVWQQGDLDAKDRLFEAVYPQLRRIAETAAGRERAGHTLDAGALVNEVYLRLFAAAPAPLP